MKFKGSLGCLNLLLQKFLKLLDKQETSAISGVTVHVTVAQSHSKLLLSPTKVLAHSVTISQEKHKDHVATLCLSINSDYLQGWDSEGLIL